MKPIIVSAASADKQDNGDTFISHIRWVGATTAAHEAIIKDGNGDVFWRSVANAANYVESDHLERTALEGFSVPTLGSGTLYIYTGREGRN